MIATNDASTLYASAHCAGRVRQVWARLWGQSRRLLDLSSVAATGTVGDRRAAGIQTVPIRQIRGSEGRCDDFDSEFHPLKDHTEERWASVARAYMRGLSLPPVELIQLGAVYFVRDGHHRISAAKALGQQEIDAVVTVWQVAEPIQEKQPVAERSEPRRSRALLPSLAWRSAGDA
ncbi:MAG TPA: hypothetical protein VFU22_08425 [Roseiflexaceae bacterium]|nr:hypothetical protein [Roseiflexaceae bacterium]